MNNYFNQALEQLAKKRSLKMHGSAPLLLELFVASRKKKQIVIAKDPSL